ncbi:MAG: recombinase family protein, partial [Lachnospiraceae bacterium]|nr:recombinase family protein [Lachnospiraceae bacterium]
MHGKNTVTNSSEYVIALYIRLSQEDRDISPMADKAESNSITNQRALLWDFIKRHEEFADCTVIEKCDDGYSGVLFDSRPGFKELIELAKAGRVNCIIVKDFSRFGRNYVELGDYLEQYFPFLGIRFISVNDNYDSKNFEGTTGGLDVAFKNMIYDFYSREFSKKQQLAWKRMAEKGEYNAHCALYGYKKSADNIHKLVIHEETGKIVKEIFELVASGLSTLKVAKMLNEREIL